MSGKNQSYTLGMADPTPEVLLQCQQPQIDAREELAEACGLFGWDGNAPGSIGLYRYIIYDMCINVNIYIYLFIYLSIYLYICMYIYIYMYYYICMYVHMYIIYLGKLQ